MITRRALIGSLLPLVGGLVLPWEPKRVYSFPSAYTRWVELDDAHGRQLTGILKEGTSRIRTVRSVRIPEFCEIVVRDNRGERLVFQYSGYEMLLAGGDLLEVRLPELRPETETI